LIFLDYYLFFTLAVDSTLVSCSRVLVTLDTLKMSTPNTNTPAQVGGLSPAQLAALSAALPPDQFTALITTLAANAAPVAAPHAAPPAAPPTAPAVTPQVLLQKLDARVAEIKKALLKGDPSEISALFIKIVSKPDGIDDCPAARIQLRQRWDVLVDEVRKAKAKAKALAKAKDNGKSQDNSKAKAKGKGKDNSQAKSQDNSKAKAKGKGKDNSKAKGKGPAQLLCSKCGHPYTPGRDQVYCTQSDCGNKH